MKNNIDSAMIWLNHPNMISITREDDTSRIYDISQLEVGKYIILLATMGYEWHYNHDGHSLYYDIGAQKE